MNNFYLHHPSYPNNQQQHLDHYPPPPSSSMNHHHLASSSSVYHHYPSSNHNLYGGGGGINSGYQNSGFGFQPPHLHSYTPPPQHHNNGTAASSSHPHPPPPMNDRTHSYYHGNHDVHHNGSIRTRIVEDKPPLPPYQSANNNNNEYYPTPPPTRYSTGKEYGRVTTTIPKPPPTTTPSNHHHHSIINNSHHHHNEQTTNNKPSEKSNTTTMDNVKSNSKFSFKLDNNNKRTNSVDLQPQNKRQKHQALRIANYKATLQTQKLSNEKIVNNNSNSNINSNHEEKSSNDNNNENLDLYRVLRICTEKSSVLLSENDIFKHFPNALKVRKENQRDFLVEFSSLVDMIPYIEAEIKEEETVNISIPKSLIPTEYLKDTQKLVLEFVDFLKKKQSLNSSQNDGGTSHDSVCWEKLISSIKIPNNVSPYDLLEFRERRIKRTLGKTDFGILIHDKPIITDKPGFPIFYNPNPTSCSSSSSSSERFFFFAFCKTGVTFASRDEISKCFPNAKSVHFDPGDHRIIVELKCQNDFNAYKKISQSGKLMVRNHTFLLRKANTKDIPTEILNPPPPPPPPSLPSTTPSSLLPPPPPPSLPSSDHHPDKTSLLQQLRQQMDDHLPLSNHPPKQQNPTELRSALLAQMKSQPSNSLQKSKSEQSLDLNFISLSENESVYSSSSSSGSEDEFEETEMEEEQKSYSSESTIEDAVIEPEPIPPSPPPQTPQKDKTVLLSALREQMQQSTSEKKNDENNTTTPSSSSSNKTNTLGIKRKTFASHYALFHGNFHSK